VLEVFAKHEFAALRRGEVGWNENDESANERAGEECAEAGRIHDLWTLRRASPNCHGQVPPALVAQQD
jgi:hypothetical protein